MPVLDMANTSSLAVSLTLAAACSGLPAPNWFDLQVNNSLFYASCGSWLQAAAAGTNNPRLSGGSTFL